MRVAATVICTLLLLAALGPAATGGDAAFTPESATGYVHESAFEVQDQAPLVTENETVIVMDVQLEESGNATWLVSMHVPLETESEIRAFEELGEEYVRGTTDAGPTIEPFATAVEQADANTEREMEIADGVERSLRIEDSTGILRLRFQWTSFAHRSEGALIVDDAFRTETGTWLPDLKENQVLVIRPPEGYLIASVPTGPEIRDATLRWDGPETFDDDYFHIVYRADTDPGHPPSTPPVTDTPVTPTTNGESGAQTILFIAILFLGGGLTAYYVVDRRRDEDRPIPGATLLESITTNGHEPPEGDAAGATIDGDVVTGIDGQSEQTPEDPFAGIDEELLSDEERVLRLLEANGGRMKQARIVKETDWSNAKVSQLLSGMDEDGEIDKLRIGRENLISLPDIDVEDFEN